MSAITKLGPRAIMPSTTPASEPGDWERLPQKKRDIALARHRLIKPALERVAAGVFIKPAAQHLHKLLESGRAPVELIAVARTLGRKGTLPSWQTLERWVTEFTEGGMMGLATQHKGSTRAPLACEARALRLLDQGSRPRPGEVAKRLQQEGYEVSYHQVRALWKSLPANRQENSRGRIGATTYANTQGYYTRRTTEGVPVGSCYQSDGNKMPIYLQHPTGNRPSRWELTPVIDVTSRYLVGYWLEEDECASGTLHALTDAILKNDHVCLDFQSDNGPGFKNRRSKRFLLALGITESHPRARNPKANGYIEKWHDLLQNELLKFLPGYCGKSMSPEIEKQFLARVEKGEEKLLTLEQFKDELNRFVHWYNHARPHGSLDGRTPAELWATLERRPPVDMQDIFYWEEEQRVVQRGTVSLFGREYLDAALFAHNRTVKGTGKVLVEYCLHDDAVVKVRTLDGRWICDAKLEGRRPYRSESHIKDAAQRQLEQKRKRLARKQEELERRNQRTIDADQTTQILDGISDAPAVGGDTISIAMDSLEGPAFDPFGCLPGFEEPAQKDRLDGHLFDPLEP